jgi:hypothetical protein
MLLPIKAYKINALQAFKHRDRTNLWQKMEQGRSNLRLNNNLPAVIKGDPEAPGKVTANNGLVAKYPNNGSSFACISKFGNFHPAKVCGREDTRYLIRKSEAKITVRGFAIRQKPFRENYITIKTSIQKRFNGFTSLVYHNS